MIALVDCNSFYCSCEIIFRPELKERPVIVLSNNDGCAIARTPKAKELGIEMGVPYFKIKDLCKRESVSIFSANFSLYTNISDRVMLTLSEFTELLEVYSVDEAFLSLKGIPENKLQSFGEEIKRKIEKNIGVPVGVGIGRTKVLAKVANNLAKKSSKSNGVVALWNKNLEDLALERIQVGDLWGVGRANHIKMKELGILTAKDLRDYKNDKRIQKIFTKIGLGLKKELQGMTCFDLNQEVQKKKEIMCSRSFGQGVFDLESLKEAVASYISSASARMREQKSVCQIIEVFFHTNPFKNQEQYYASERIKLNSPTLDTLKLTEESIKIVEKMYRPGLEYQKAGIRLRSITDQNEWQLGLFDKFHGDKREKLMEVIDKINRKEGPHTIKSLACGLDGKAWAMKRNFKSPRYTTSWNELPEAN